MSYGNILRLAWNFPDEVAKNPLNLESYTRFQRLPEPNGICNGNPLPRLMQRRHRRIELRANQALAACSITTLPYVRS